MSRLLQRGAESVLRWAQRMKGMEIDTFVEAMEGVTKLDLALPVP